MKEAGSMWELCGMVDERMLYYDGVLDDERNGRVFDGVLLDMGKDEVSVSEHMPHTVEGVMEMLSGVFVDEGWGVDSRSWERIGCWEKVVRRDEEGGGFKMEMNCDGGVRVGRREVMRKVALLERWDFMKEKKWTWAFVKSLENRTEMKLEFWNSEEVFDAVVGDENRVCFKEVSFPGMRYKVLPPAFYKPKIQGRPFGIDMDEVFREAGYGIDRSRGGLKKFGKENKDKWRVGGWWRSGGGNSEGVVRKDGWSRMDLNSEREKLECATRVLILSRKKTRSLLYIPELKKVLINKTAIEGLCLHIRSVEYEKMSFVEQAAMMRWADVLITAHGAALANLIFLRPGSTVIEIVPWGYRYTFGAHARIFGSTHTIITAKPQSDVVLRCLREYISDRNRTIVNEKMEYWKLAVAEYERKNLVDVIQLKEYPFWSFKWGNTTAVRTCAREQNLGFDHKLVAQKLIANHIPCNRR